MTSLFANNPSRVVPDYTYFTLKHITLGHFEKKNSQSTDIGKIQLGGVHKLRLQEEWGKLSKMLTFCKLL